MISAELKKEILDAITTKEEERVGIPCPDGIPGCLVFHYQKRQRSRTVLEIEMAVKEILDRNVLS